ncbi:MAG: PH domain-containing protein [Candidatus Saccharimonadales bacterium]
MKSLSEVELELSRLGIRNRFFGKPEVRELVHILTDDEVITTAANGRYQGGFAMILTTNHRLLLVDKKLWFMSLEDIRFDMITEVDFAARVFDATVSIRTINKVLRFTSIRQKRLRDLTTYLQKTIMEIRQMSMQQQQPPQVYVQQAPQSQPASEPAIQYSPAIQQPPQPVASQNQFYVHPVHYSRPTRLRRVGAFPTASLTMQRQRYVTAKH